MVLMLGMIFFSRKIQTDAGLGKAGKMEAYTAVWKR